MKALATLLSLLRNYKSWVTGHVISNILTALFTVLTIPLVIPIFQLFFEPEAAVLPSHAPSFSISHFNEFMQYQIQQRIHTEGDKEVALLKVALGLIILFFFKNLFTYLSLYFIAPVRNGIIRDLRQQIYAKLTNLPLQFFTEERRGDLLSRITADTMEVEWSILSTLEKMVRDPLTIVGTLGFMLLVSAKLTLFVLAMLLFTGLVIGGVARHLKRQSHAVQASLGRLMSLIEESLRGIKVIKAYHAGDFMQSRFNEENNRYRRLQTRLLWRRDVASPLSEFMGIIAVCALFIFGAHMVYAGEIESEVFLAYLLAFFYTITPAKNLSAALYQVQKGAAAYERINHILQYDNPILISQGSQSCLPLTDAITLDQVSYRYDGSEVDVLHDISLSIPHGQTTAFVGASGSGKSTLADILLRFYDPQRGEVRYDGVPLQRFELGSLRQQFGIVTQEPILFHGSVADNIAFGMVEASPDQIVQAAKLAHAHEFIMQMPQDYASQIGDAGVKLSGGQRQRIALARAILRDPPILILDEATSALDSASEQAVQQALATVLKNRTAIVIAHRLSTIQHADRIVVLHDGQIVEIGTHDQLLANQGAYYEFVSLQQMNDSAH